MLRKTQTTRSFLREGDAMRRSIEVYGGKRVRIGTLHFNAEGAKESAAFEYSATWLAHQDAFAIDPTLPLVTGPQFPGQGAPSVFFGCFADSEPDGWGRKVILRDRKKRGETTTPNSLEFLLAIDDATRVGALRFCEAGGAFLAAPTPGARATPPVIEMAHLLRAAAAVEANTETAADLRLLLAQGSPLGGMRPKCTVIDADGALFLAKFPSENDERSVVRGEALALEMARQAGIEASSARLVQVGKKPVLLVRRFDRHAGERVMYQSARTFIAARSASEYAYTDFVDALRQSSAAPTRDIEEIWRRIVFSILIKNTDDHLNNHGFLHVGRGQWRLAPVFDVNPAPDRAPELKTMTTHETGYDATIDNAFAAAHAFGIKITRSKEILGDVVAVTKRWRAIAKSTAVGMTAKEAAQFHDAFVHPQSIAAEQSLSRVS